MELREQNLSEKSTPVPCSLELKDAPELRETSIGLRFILNEASSITRPIVEQPSSFMSTNPTFDCTWARVHSNVLLCTR